MLEEQATTKEQKDEISRLLSEMSVLEKQLVDAQAGQDEAREHLRQAEELKVSVIIRTWDKGGNSDIFVQLQC